MRTLFAPVTVGLALLAIILWATKVITGEVALRVTVAQFCIMLLWSVIDSARTPKRPPATVLYAIAERRIAAGEIVKINVNALTGKSTCAPAVADFEAGGTPQ